MAFSLNFSPLALKLPGAYQPQGYNNNPVSFKGMASCFNDIFERQDDDCAGFTTVKEAFDYLSTLGDYDDCLIRDPEGKVCRLHHEANTSNHFIRSNEEPHREAKAILMLLDNDFKNLAPTEEDLVLYRGILLPKENSCSKAYGKKLLAAKCGDMISEKSFIFTARDKGAAKRYMSGEGQDKNKFTPILLRIQVDKGAKLSRIDSEGEFLFPRNSQFKITDKKITESGQHEISLHYVTD